MFGSLRDYGYEWEFIEGINCTDGTRMMYPDTDSALIWINERDN